MMTATRTPAKQYPTRDEAAAAWLRKAKKAGLVAVIGGGWWWVTTAGRRTRVQGLTALGRTLQIAGAIEQVPSTDDAAPGVWAWSVKP